MQSLTAYSGWELAQQEMKYGTRRTRSWLMLIQRNVVGVNEIEIYFFKLAAVKEIEHGFCLFQKIRLLPFSPTLKTKIYI